MGQIFVMPLLLFMLGRLNQRK